MIHLYLGTEIMRDTKTGCGIKLENLSRADSSVPYRNNAFVTCEKCTQKVAKINQLRGK